MRRGFTLLELLIVIIIVGVMATLGLTQYTAVVERSRGAEARQILGQLRSVCAALYMDGNTNLPCVGANITNLGLGGAAGQIPSGACQTSHFFQYAAAAAHGTNGALFTATRCLTGTGKNPGNAVAGTLTLDVDYSTGAAAWASPNGY